MNNSKNLMNSKKNQSYIEFLIFFLLSIIECFLSFFLF